MRARLGSVGASVLGLLLLWGCEKPPVAQREVIRPVKLFKVKSAELAGTERYPGRVAAAVDAELSFEVPGRLVALGVQEGDQVTKGASSDESVGEPLGFR